MGKDVVARFSTICTELAFCEVGWQIFDGEEDTFRPSNDFFSKLVSCPPSICIKGFNTTLTSAWSFDSKASLKLTVLRTTRRRELP